MSEQMPMAPVYDPATIAAEHTVRTIKTRTVLFAAGALVTSLSGCSVWGGGESTPADNSPTPSASPSVEAVSASDACGTESIDLSANRANSVFGSPEGLYPALSKPIKSGETQLISKAEAVKAMKEQVTHDVRALGVFYAYFIETRDKKQLPGFGTLERAGKLTEDFGNNPKLAADALARSCEALNFLEPTTKFAVTKFQAQEVETVRAENSSTIVKIDSGEIKTGGILSGFTLGYNHVDASLTAEDRVYLDKVSSLTLVDQSGTVVVNETYGPSTIEISQTAPKHPISIKTNGNEVVAVKPTNKPGEVPAGSNNQQNQQSQGGSSSKQSSTGTGSGPSGGGADHQSGPNTGPSSGTQSGGTGTGSGPSGGGGNTGPGPSTGPTGPSGGGGEGTPTPVPTHEQPTPTPTPTPTKAPDPCDPNTGEICGTNTAMTLQFTDNQWNIV